MKSTKAMRAASVHVFELEPLEGRQLLAADLSVSWDTPNLHIPGLLVPGDHFNPTGGANRLEAPIQITNNGPLGAAGTVRVDFYLSTDRSLDLGRDIPIGSFPAQPFSLSVYTGNPNQLGAFSPDMTIPSDVAAGRYYLIVKITPGSAFGDTDAGNNIAVSTSLYTVVHQFGDIAGRTGVAMTLRDTDGTNVTFAQTGGGFGDVASIGSGFGITLTNSNDFTQVHITASGGNGRYDLNSVTINGAVGVFSAPQGRLTGPLTTTTGFGAMTFGDVVGPQTITVPASSRNPSFTLGNVSELTIDSAVGINSINVLSWIDRDGTADHISAPWLDALTSAGNFYPSIYLSGGSHPYPSSGDTLGPVNIGGVVKAGAWSIDGSGGAVSVYATTAGWSASYSSGVTSFATVSSFRGVLTGGQYIGTITSGKDILAGKILAGAYLGADGLFGGSGPNADTFRQGSISDIQVMRNVAGTLISAGLDPVDGVFNNGDDTFIGGSRSYIGRIIIGHIAGAQARFLANSYSNSFDGRPSISIGGSNIDWHADPRFAIHTVGPTGSVLSSMVTNNGGSMTAMLNLHIASGGLIDLDSIADGTIRITGPNGFSGLGLLVSKANDGNTNDGSSAYTTFFVRLNNVGDPLPSGTFTISFVPGMIADTRGNAAQAVDLGTFVA